MILSACINGCSVVKPLHQEDPFRVLYDEASLTKKDRKEEAPLPKLTLSAHQMPLPLFSRVLSDTFGVGIVFSDTLRDKMITAEFKNTDLSTVFTVISRQIGVDIVKVGNTYYLGQLKDEDKGILIRRVLSYDVESIKAAVAAMLSPQGRFQVLSNSVVLLSDNDFVLRRAAEALDYMETVENSCWIVQLYFLVLRKDALLEAGFTMSSSGTISYNLSENEVKVSDIQLDGLFNSLMESSYADLYASPMFILRDNSSGRWQDGQRVPIPKKTVSDYGTVTTTGFDYVDTGVDVKATVRESRGGGILTLAIGLSAIQSYVEYAPVTSNTSCDISVEMEPQKIYLLGELQKYSALDSQTKTLTFGRDSGKSVLQVWGKIYKIRGGAKSAPALAPVSSAEDDNKIPVDGNGSETAPENFDNKN